MAFRGIARWGAAAIAVGLALAGGYLSGVQETGVQETGVQETGGVGADPRNPVLVAEGQTIYQQHCASCHGARGEGQPHWQQRQANGRLPAPPHDPSGHTWHHPDPHLFIMVKNGVAALAPPGYQSDMPAYAGVLSDRQILAVLAYIKSRWPPDVLLRQETRTAAFLAGR